MLSKFLVVIAALASTTLASPLADCKANCARSFGIAPPSVSSYQPGFGFNGYGGFASFHGFDEFYGPDNFDGSHSEQHVVTDHELVCHSERVEIIQQRLAVIRELAKKIITEQICEVETQVVVFEQFHAGLGHFKGDLRHVSGRKVGFDRNIAGHFGEIIGSDGFCTTNDFGFSGHDIGQEVVCASGTNWDDNHSFVTVNDAYLAARHAHRFSSKF